MRLHEILSTTALVALITMLVTMAINIIKNSDVD